MSTETGTRPDRVGIVGGGVATGFLLRALAQRGFEGEVVVFAAEQHEPYDRTEVSKSIARSGHAGLRPLAPGSGARFVHEAAEALDPVRRTIASTSGEHRFDAIVVATGSRPIEIPGWDFAPALYGADSALGVHADAGRSALVVGGGFIGSEVAVSIAANDRAVTVLDLAALPLEARLGSAVAGALATSWPERVWRGGTTIESRVSETVYLLSDGEQVEAEAVYTALGARPDSRLWGASAVAQRDGRIELDELGRTSAENVYAIGDAATWRIAGSGRWHPAAHWDDARITADVCAAQLSGSPSRALGDHVPYFWSEQFAGRIQVVGHLDPSVHHIEILEHREDGAGSRPELVAVASDAGTVSAIVLLNRPRALAVASRAVRDRIAVDSLGEHLGLQGAPR
ncbi:MAG: FAD-dependent oxidoreductase [Actinomycetales bacterium]|nr:FAD-dependent oxidoreductase [Actinomycetales bacterium]